jgi:hypothetical protein
VKTLIKLLVTIVALNAVGQVGWAAWNYFELRDSAAEAVMFGAQETPAMIKGRIVGKAVDLRVPLVGDGVVVSRQGLRTQADAVYTQNIEVFPGYIYPYTFSFRVDALSMTGLK